MTVEMLLMVRLMILRTKFNIDDEVYVISKNYVLKEITCPVCGGAGFIHNGPYMAIRCGRCDGEKVVGVSILEWHVGLPLRILDIQARCTSSNVSGERDSYPLYRFKNPSVRASPTLENLTGSIPENQIFLTELDAQKVCDALNR